MASKPEALEAATDRILKDLGCLQIASDRPRLSEQEERVLELYDRIEDVRLRLAVIDASSSMPLSNSKPSGEKLQQELKRAERELVDARSVYLIRKSVIDDVLTLDPILKAVHADPFTQHRERDLHQLINQRDVLSMAHGNLTNSMQEVQTRLLATRVESIQAVDENQKLAHDLRTIASELERGDVDQVEDEQLRAELSSAREGLEEAKRRRQLIKGVVQAMVSGSGVDWADDERLLGLVLEEET